MKIILSLLLFCFLFGDTLHQTLKEINDQHVPKKGFFLSNMIENVLHYQWEDEELPCLQKTLDIIGNVRNHTIWATWVWDSMQSPTGVFFGTKNQFGNDDQCIHPPWIKTHPELMTQYCLADIVLSDKRADLKEDPYISADLYVSPRSKNRLTTNKLTWGLCLPATCKPNSIKKFAEIFLNNSHLQFAVPEATVSIHSCQTYIENTELSYKYYATLAFIGSMILLTLFCTNYYENHRHTKKENRAIVLAKAFSLIENTAELFKEKEDEIRSLNSLKFLTSCLIVYAHYIMLCINIGFKNQKSFDRFIESSAFYTFFHLDILVDTFIMISGILLIKSFLATNKPVTMTTVIKRYVRLTYVPMVLILFTTQVIKHYAKRSLLSRSMNFEVECCRNNWWTILLTINNYVDFTNSCFSFTWSNSCDFHLTILGTGLYWLYQKNRSLGLKAFYIGTIASVLLPSVATFRGGLGPIHYNDLEALGEIRKRADSPTYVHTHLRCGPYFIGLAFGFLLSLYKPADFKKLTAKLSFTIFTFGLSLAAFILMLGGYMARHKYSDIEVAIYAGTNRSIWAIGLCLIIFSCEYGHIPLITDFLHWPVFGPLSKLSYSLYLTHFLLIIGKISNTMSPAKLYLTYMVIDSLGVITFCCGLSYVLWLLFEAPMNNIVAIVLRKRSYNENKNEALWKNEVQTDVKKIT